MILTYENRGMVSPHEFQSCKVTQFDDATVDRLSKTLVTAVQHGQFYFPLVIDAIGGSIYHMFAMADMIRQAPIAVCTIIQGHALSAAAMLASFGTKGFRFASPNATIMLHNIRGSAEGLSPLMKSKSDYFNELNDRIFAEMEDHCHVSRGFYRQLVRSVEGGDVYVSSQRAVELGLIDHARLPTFTVVTDVNVRVS